MRVVFVTAEVAPIAKTGGLGDVCGSLPKELVKRGHDVVVVMPYYRQAREYFEREGIQPEPVASAEITWANWTADAAFFRATLPNSEVPLILVANDYFFDRDAIYSTHHGFHDFLHRYTFFCRAVIRACELLGIQAEILHCHDWHTALIPVYLHSGLRGGSDVFRGTRSVYTIHNLNYQGVAGAPAFALTGLHSRYWAADALEHFGEVNPMKAGIIFADQVTTVSPNYAREIRTPALGAGLDGVLRTVSYKLTGILNGIDVEEWNPATDSYLEANFEPGKLHGKTVSKRMLAREAGMKYKPKTPIIGVVSRLVEQKGFQLLLPILGKLLRAGAQCVVLGSGDAYFESGFEQAAMQHPDSCRVWLGFDNALAHRLYAGCDLLLMPSMYEPCGLNQMYALRYGTVPVVRLTGGLVDTVIPFDGTNKEVATGFGFVTPNAEDLYFATWTGMLNHKDARLWKTLQDNGMQQDFSWTKSARRYEEIYRLAAGI